MHGVRKANDFDLPGGSHDLRFKANRRGRTQKYVIGGVLLFLVWLLFFRGSDSTPQKATQDVPVPEGAQAAAGAVPQPTAAGPGAPTPTEKSTQEVKATAADGVVDKSAVAPQQPNPKAVDAKASSEGAFNVKTYVDNLIETNKILVFSKTWCPHSKAAKATLNSLSNDVRVVEIDEHVRGDLIQAYLAGKFDHSTVPCIFINKEFIGGNDKLQSLKAASKLAAKIKGSSTS